MTFLDFARANGLDIDIGKFYASDRIIRCGTIDKPRSTNGAYLWNGERGWVYNWSGEAKTVWYNDPHAKPWTPEEKALWASKRADAASEQQKRYEKAAEEAHKLIASSDISTHPYLQRKGFSEHKAFVLGDKLLVPMRNVVTNKLQGVQQIEYNFETKQFDKKMLTGMRAKNAVYRIGDLNSKESWLVEGYATGLSVAHALKMCGLKASVIVCFSASNLVCVADQIQGQRFIFADNDESKTGQKAAEATGLPWTMADKVGQDANDLERSDGVFAVVEKIMLCRKEFFKNL